MTNTAAIPAEAEYGADQLQKLDPMDHIRHRISMYLGDNTGEGGLSTALRELLDNAQDEFLNGHGKTIKLTFFEDGSAEVEDSGRGIPTGINKATGMNGIVLALANIGAGGKFNSASGGYQSGAGGLNGVGASATQAISERFDVTVWQNGAEHFMSFSKGKPGHWDKPNNPKAKFTRSDDLIKREDKRPAAVKKARPTGTTVRMWPDLDIFVPGAKFDVETIKFRLKSTAFLLPGLRVEINDYRDPANHVEDVYEFDGGIAEMLETIEPDRPVMKPVHFETVGEFTETASIVAADGHSTTGEITRKVDIDVAFVYGDGYDNTTRSFVNIINTKHGGTHVQGFERALSRVLVNTIRNTPRMLTAKEESPIIDDVREGITAIISIKFPEPQFTGQEKSTLGTQAITAVVSQAVDTELKKWLENKKNATDMKTMLTKIVNAARNRTAARQAKETARRKTALSSASMPAKLVDCGTNDTQFSELHIVEGNSAAGSLEEGRNSEYQALIPIRGKILNAYRASTADVLKNAEAAAIIQVVGAGSGRTFDIEQMRYARIVITADADVDGNHIRSLLITLFWQQMRPLVEAGRLYTSVPPLYSVKTTGKNSETIYITDDDEVEVVLARLKKEKKAHGPLSRFKGLGEMDPEELRVTTLDPANRILRQITVDDAGEAEAMLDLAMGKDVPPRKAWIENYRALIDVSLLDV